MIWEAGPDSHLLVRVAAVTVLYLHIASGMVGIASGALALSMRKGGRAHRIVGNVFFVSMMIMAAIGAAVSPFLPTPVWVNVIAGALTFYLVATAWMTVRRDHIGRLEVIAFLFGLATATGGFALGLIGKSYTEILTSPSSGALVFGAFAAIAAAGDLKMILRGGVSGRPRVSRHLWRMCLAFLIAVVSLFIGQQKVLPEVLRELGFHRIPTYVALLAMLAWMLRVRFTKRWQTVR